MKMYWLVTKASQVAFCPSVFFRRLAFTVCIVALSFSVNAQESEYIKTITDRSAKIVNTLGINDSAVYKKVLDNMVQQYAGLNTIDEKTKSAIAAIKASGLSKSETDTAVKTEENKKKEQITALHNRFISQLGTNLTNEQIEKVKDGMTYSVLPITYKAYQEMIPRLTAEEKKYIYANLVEARELAMDAGSSKEKHGWFGKYKGRINNYLSSRGYDMKKESEDWAKRTKEKQAGN